MRKYFLLLVLCGLATPASGMFSGGSRIRRNRYSNFIEDVKKVNGFDDSSIENLDQKVVYEQLGELELKSRYTELPNEAKLLYLMWRKNSKSAPDSSAKLLKELEETKNDLGIARQNLTDLQKRFNESTVLDLEEVLAKAKRNNWLWGVGGATLGFAAKSILK